ncbi:MAG TPA: hypothetical protein VE869_09755 [Gemmatimonas sp.]|nr:hypothetical protein [Gemmatimonas sp.]
MTRTRALVSATLNVVSVAALVGPRDAPTDAALAVADGDEPVADDTDDGGGVGAGAGPPAGAPPAAQPPCINVSTPVSASGGTKRNIEFMVDRSMGIPLLRNYRCR